MTDTTTDTGRGGRYLLDALGNATRAATVPPPADDDTAPAADPAAKPAGARRRATEPKE